MELDLPTCLLGGLSPQRFMRRHWHKTPLLVRQAVPEVTPPIDRAGLFALAARDEVESRLVRREGRHWHLRRGPLPRRSLPPLSQPGWTVLVQGLDLHVDAAHRLLSRFRFVPDARLDDLMVSYASDGGGVGPHIDSYDVFLLQVAGRRRWRIGRCPQPALRDDVPLKMLTRFDVEQDCVLEPGDMLYLPPGWAHDGAAVGGECMTASIGFRAPTDVELAQALLARLADEPAATCSRRYRDRGRSATAHPGQVPSSLESFARESVRSVLTHPDAIARSLGEWLTEPKPQVWFEACRRPGGDGRLGLVADRRTRMAYDSRHLFVNGESYRSGGRDARLMRRLADQRFLSAPDAMRLSGPARDLVTEWMEAGWLHPTEGDAHDG
ncbi:MAG TPA: cupin domain-containing protein [Burkholderiaceae bacterium]|nr:cupin domain-containing protein [Burkholderiaceae bacterium]